MSVWGHAFWDTLVQTDTREEFSLPLICFVVSPHPETDQLIDQLTTRQEKKRKFPRPAPLKLLFKCMFKCGRDKLCGGCAEQHLT